jgi:diguanylate cyclase (GGDEF)-like protein
MPGVYLTFLVSVAGAVYAVVFADAASRTPVLVLMLFAIFVAIVIWCLPWDRIVRSRWREPMFLAWSFGDIAVVAALAAIDGGGDSGLALVFFIPIVFAGMTYPTWSVAVLGVTTVAGYVALGVIAGDPGGYVLLFSACLACMAVLSVWQARNHEAGRRELARASRTDPLTESLNRRGFEERCVAELARAERHGGGFALILLDLDRFKAVNDTSGHAAGDELLCWIVTELGNQVRPVDALGRLGGDEFAVLLPDAGRPTAQRVADRMLGSISHRITASIGIAAYPADGADLEHLLSRADADLYAAKRADTPVVITRERLGWASALAHSVDQRMGGHPHSDLVAGHAVAIAERLGWEGEDVEALRIAATLHDVGKASVPESILRKPGMLTLDEYEQVKLHAAKGADLVARIEGLERIVPWIRHSHEYVDGSGYPDGLAGDEIPEASRILLVADAYDAITGVRPYRHPLGPAEAIAELRANAGRQFDADCVEALAEIVTEGYRAAA